MLKIVGVELNGVNTVNRKAGETVIPQAVIKMTVPLKGQREKVSELMAMMMDNEPLVVSLAPQQTKLDMNAKEIDNPETEE